MIRIVSDSSCDIWTLEGADFVTVPLTISTDREEFVDDETLDLKYMVEALANSTGKTSTACPSVDGWIKAFGEADTIYVATITSGLSGTYNSAVVAAEMYLEDHPDAKIRVFDTLSTGPEQCLLLEKIAELVNEGCTFEEVCEQAEEYLSKSRLFFVLKSLHNLAQNGRVNKVVASAVGVLGISVLGTATEEGKIDTVGKCRGEKKVISNVINQLEGANYNGGKVRISHVDNSELAEKIKTAINYKYPNADIKIHPTRGLCSYYAEKGGVLVGMEGK